MALAHFAALGTAFLGCLCDVSTRRIPNVLTFSAALAALTYHTASAGWSGLGYSASGAAVGLALFLPLFALRGMGGGDVKLLAALGAWMGPGHTVWLALFAALAGGPLALVVAIWRGYGRELFSNIWSLLMFWRIAGIQPHPTLTLDSASSPRLPYAIPIAVGLVATLWLR
jgi:prepilin peptidase CpaA